MKNYRPNIELGGITLLLEAPADENNNIIALVEDMDAFIDEIVRTTEGIGRLREWSDDPYVNGVYSFTFEYPTYPLDKSIPALMSAILTAWTRWAR